MDEAPIAYEPALRPVEPVQPAAPGPEPKVSLTVKDHRGHEIAADTLRILGDVPVDGETIPVIPVQTVPRTHPHEALIVPQNAGDIVRRKTRAGPDMGKFQVLWLRMSTIYSQQRQ